LWQEKVRFLETVMAWHRFIWLLSLLLFLLLLLEGRVGGQEEELVSESVLESSEDPQSIYFYLNNPDAFPIIEFEEPRANQKEGEEETNDLQNFFSSAKESVCIVEFYAHWCPHCQHFKSHYIEFARKLQEVAGKYGVAINVYGVSCVAHKAICRKQGVTAYPKVKLYQAGSINGTFVNDYELHPFQIMRMIPGVSLDSAMGLEVSSEMKEDGKKKLLLRNTPVEEEDATRHYHFLKRTKEDIYSDAYLSFDFAMRNAIFTTEGPLMNKTKEVFEEWLMLLQATLPPNWGLQTMIGEIIANFEEAVKSEKNLLQIVDYYPPKKKSWSHSCSRGDGYAGYTCGLWELFHIMTIGTVEFNSVVVGDDWAYYRTEDAAKTLRAYIEHFFGCEVCRLNFLHAFDACAFDRCNRLFSNKVGEIEDWLELPMWLFETHNAVNVRLLKEQAERDHWKSSYQAEIEVLWPSRSDCPMCWHDDGRWDQDMVYRYLRVAYWYAPPTT
jgi:thiol-disulfide isomerase/thioredoxin